MRTFPLGVLIAVVTAVTCVTGAGCDICDGDGDEVRERATILSQADVDDLAGVACILGDLEIGDGANPVDAPLDLSALSDLLIVEGDFAVHLATQLVALDLPRLTFVGRRGIERDGERFRGGFFIRANNVLAKLDLPDLTDVGGCFEVNDNPLLPSDEVDDLFAQVRSHAFPGTCDGPIEANIGNTGGRP